MSTVPNITLLFWKGVRMLCSLPYHFNRLPLLHRIVVLVACVFFDHVKTLTFTPLPVIYSFHGTRFPDNSSPPSLFFLSFSSLKPNSKNKSAMPSTPKPTKTTLTKTANTRKLFVKKHLNLLNPT